MIFFPDDLHVTRFILSYNPERRCSLFVYLANGEGWRKKRTKENKKGRKENGGRVRTKGKKRGGGMK